MNELIKISEISERYAITTRSLRYYEDMGLISSTRSDDYAYRLYDKSAIKRLEQILILRRLNISIKDIRRVFDISGSNVVLEILDKKVNDIDDEVALLHELKEIVLEFIRQIKDADFSNDSDVKQLYEKAKDIEAQIVNINYDGNSSNVNRLLEITGKLEKKPDIVRKLPHFYNIFNVSKPIEAYELYHKAFGVEKVSEDYPNGAAHIGIEVNGFFILLRQEEEPVADKYPLQGCCVRLETEEDLRRAYDILTKEGKDYKLHSDWGWTSSAAFVTDKYSISWMLCV
ncbi:MAG: MerR family transcriptional regulator [Oscillospiraceae bacterium]|nr:MerR family transcriptional regulator [Oscillospiraceae bacterium]